MWKLGKADSRPNEVLTSLGTKRESFDIAPFPAKMNQFEQELNQFQQIPPVTHYQTQEQQPMQQNWTSQPLAPPPQQRRPKQQQTMSRQPMSRQQTQQHPQDFDNEAQQAANMIVHHFQQQQPQQQQQVATCTSSSSQLAQQQPQQQQVSTCTSASSQLSQPLPLQQMSSQVFTTTSNGIASAAAGGTTSHIENMMIQSVMCSLVSQSCQNLSMTSLLSEKISTLSDRIKLLEEKDSQSKDMLLKEFNTKISALGDKLNEMNEDNGTDVDIDYMKTKVDEIIKEISNNLSKNDAEKSKTIELGMEIKTDIEKGFDRLVDFRRSLETKICEEVKKSISIMEKSLAEKMTEVISQQLLASKMLLNQKTPATSGARRSTTTQPRLAQKRTPGKRPFEHLDVEEESQDDEKVAAADQKRKKKNEQPNKTSNKITISQKPNEIVENSDSNLTSSFTGVESEIEKMK